MYPSDDVSMSPILDQALEPSALVPTRHPRFSFNDGNIAILAGNYYFLVHQGFLSRHSAPLSSAINALDSSPGSLARYSEGRPVLEVQDSSSDIYHFLLAFYDGVSDMRYTAKTFNVVSSLLRMSTKYQVQALRRELLRGLSIAWPTTMTQWDIRESLVTGINGAYEPRQSIPHPILVINLARDVDAPEILPAAFYDLSRCPPSRTAAGHVCSSQTYRLSHEDMLSLLKGKEHTSRFLSTFIVNHLEGRSPSPYCIHQKHDNPSYRRTCQAAFEVITFEILRDVNGVAGHRSSDPLFSILEAEMMQTRLDLQVTQNPNLRPCEHCGREFSAVVSAAREELWRQLPRWFGVEDISVWG